MNLSRLKLPTATRILCPDSFAAVFLIRAKWDNEIIAALNQLEAIAALEGESGKVSYWNEHALTRQRIYKEPKFAPVSIYKRIEVGAGCWHLISIYDPILCF
jgi:hypothetical protein